MTRYSKRQEEAEYALGRLMPKDARAVGEINVLKRQENYILGEIGRGNADCNPADMVADFLNKASFSGKDAATRAAYIQSAGMIAAAVFRSVRNTGPSDRADAFAKSAEGKTGFAREADRVMAHLPQLISIATHMSAPDTIRLKAYVVVRNLMVHLSAAEQGRIKPALSRARADFPEVERNLATILNGPNR
ncbi:MAG: hypothetical protein DI551_08280 [Micavibrio aeruginosavorus]|uniref:Uncharacterized protein n=1 Tax=Micavibrio aeruginosavorus TaxID=349221 RepID=A0A2W5Q1D6_9BACT|nr:MAG: hypothetical protein DI551_08280 [Micavibrio aeruginosavorus]